MREKHVSDWFIYRYRYFIGYAFVILSLVGIIVFSGLYVPGGLSQDELQTAIMSADVALETPSSAPTVNMPYHLLQNLSIEWFGFSNFGIKAPSLLLATVSAVGMFFLLRQWFRANIAVLASILAITTGQFLVIAQSGTADIMYVFLPVWLILSGTMMVRSHTLRALWYTLFFGLLALSLYTPLSIYVLISLMIISISHPHVRYIVNKLSVPLIAIGAGIETLLAVPLLYRAMFAPMNAIELLGIPEHWPNMGDNLAILVQSYFNFITVGESTFMTPIFGAGSLVLIVLGFLSLSRTHYTARSYLIIAWSVLLLPMIIVNPWATTALFVPSLMLMAMGIETLFREWYKLFPNNPYARVTGLIPLIILVGGLMFSGIERHGYGYYYTPTLRSQFTQDVSLVRNTLQDINADRTIIVTTSKEKSMYGLIAKDFANTSVSNSVPKDFSGTIIATRNSGQTKLGVADSIITSSTSSDADRFYIYKK